MGVEERQRRRLRAQAGLASFEMEEGYSKQ